MEFTASSILLTAFAGVVAGLVGYLASYAKSKGEIKAATEELKQTIRNLTETTHAVELKKAGIAADAALAADQRKVVYALAIATQSLVHSMCWLAWDARTRGTVREKLADSYDSEAHRMLPEIFSQLAVLRLLDLDLHTRAYAFASRLAELDMEFGEAIALAERDKAAGTKRLADLFHDANHVQIEIGTLFGGGLQLVGPTGSARSLVGKNDV